MVKTVNPDQPTSSSTRAEKRRAQRRALIIAAAEEELRQSGIAGTTLAGVGDRVGLSKGALYYYVDSRDALLALVLDDGLRVIRDEAARLVADDATRSTSSCRSAAFTCAAPSSGPAAR